MADWNSGKIQLGRVLYLMRNCQMAMQDFFSQNLNYVGSIKAIDLKKRIMGLSFSYLHYFLYLQVLFHIFVSLFLCMDNYHR